MPTILCKFLCEQIVCRKRLAKRWLVFKATIARIIIADIYRIRWRVTFFCGIFKVIKIYLTFLLKKRDHFVTILQK